MKNKFKGTQGEWRFRGESSSLVDIGTEEKGVAYVYKINNESEANAKLIKNAPDLLFALQEMIAFAEFHGYTSSTEINNARKVIEETLT